jgi:hypothetical protein
VAKAAGVAKNAAHTAEEVSNRLEKLPEDFAKMTKEKLGVEAELTPRA